MQKRLKSIKLVILSAIIFSWATIVFAFSFGPPASNTGAPGEFNCSSCHIGSAINTGGGSVAITGLPQSYEPGKQYNVTVTVSKSDRSRWGFQITALRDDNNSAAGTFRVTDSNRTQLTTGSVSGGTRTYVQHTATGTQQGRQGSASFDFAWTAPSSSVGSITFYAAGNAANNNGASSGDNIYTTSIKLTAMAANPAPILTSVQPNRGSASGGTEVMLVGSNFAQGLTVQFGGRAATVLSVTGNQIRVTTPAGDPGTANVAVTNPDGQLVRLNGAFTYEASQSTSPTLTSILPTSGPATGGTEVVIVGSNFVDGLTVQIGARQATILSVTGNQIRATTQPNDPGTVDVVVTNPDGQRAVLGGIFTYVGGQPDPSVRLLTPNGGDVLSAGGLPFLITWSQMSGVSATQVLELSTDSGQTFSQMIASNLTPSTTSFTFSVPAGLRSDTARIRISVLDNGVVMSDVSDQDFRILPAPTINTIKPTVTSSIKLKVSGATFQSGAVVEVNGTAATTTFKSATSLVAKKISKSLAGTQVKVRVRNPDGTISAEMTITP
jgi:large repetitive protein